MKARIEIFKQIDIHGLKTADEAEIRESLIKAHLNDYFHNVIQIVDDDEELAED